MKQYLDIIRLVLTNGVESTDRTGVGTIRIFGAQTRWNLAEGFPATTSKQLFFKPCKHELQWFLSGSTNVDELREMTWGIGSDKRTIWDDNYENQAKSLGYSHGYLGPIYGHQWRSFGGDLYGNHSVDQIARIVNELKTTPDDRGIIVSAWNPVDLDKMALRPCHCFFQFVVINGKLSLQWYQRSVDVFLGLPFNIASYALLTHIIADICGYEVGDLVWTGGDVHIYKNAIEQAKELLKPEREPLPLPTLYMPKVNSLLDLDQEFFDSIHLKDYNHHGSLKATMAV
ncbi:thymidylate synthase [Citrobacter phage IME-CF2]|uniref:Thymidylate synthase n=1 Tax=Citrobacter phage IME-CF2 TaxID=1673887 RepID=A0A0K0QSD0_9CAUD|nr:thymidylate synthase [Citrobacter phage IME-CF2]AKR15980.1 thymidylate synthase [Citrobacter phage IME-CF2]